MLPVGRRRHFWPGFVRAPGRRVICFVRRFNGQSTGLWAAQVIHTSTQIDDLKRDIKAKLGELFVLRPLHPMGKVRYLMSPRRNDEPLTQVTWQEPPKR